MIPASNVGVRRLVPMVRRSDISPIVDRISATSRTYALTLLARYPPYEAKQPRVCGLYARVDPCRKLANPYPSSISAHVKQQHAAQIERLTRRIRVLEQGLGDVYSTISDEKHPLLKDESVLASGPSPPGFRTGPPMHHDSSTYPDDMINHFGTS